MRNARLNAAATRATAWKLETGGAVPVRFNVLFIAWLVGSACPALPSVGDGYQLVCVLNYVPERAHRRGFGDALHTCERGHAYSLTIGPKRTGSGNESLSNRYVRW